MNAVLSDAAEDLKGAIPMDDAANKQAAMAERPLEEIVKTQGALRAEWRRLRRERAARESSIKERYRRLGPQEEPSVRLAMAAIDRKYSPIEQRCVDELVKIECMKSRPDGDVELTPATLETIRRVLAALDDAEG